MRRRIRALVAAVALITAVALAGCGASDGLLRADAAATPDLLAQSAQRTAEVATGRLEATITAGDATVTATGSFDAPGRAAALQVDATVPVDARGAGDTLTSEVVFVDGALYLRPGGLFGLLGDATGTPWLSVDTDDLGDLLPDDAGVPTFDPTDIDQLAERLRGEGIEVVEVGREEVRGASAVHYRATIPADPARPGLPPAVVDLWIDDDGLVRRVDAVAQGDTPVTVRAELFDLGADVSITAPPAEQVTDLGDLGGLLELLPR